MFLRVLIFMLNSMMNTFPEILLFSTLCTSRTLTNIFCICLFVLYYTILYTMLVFYKDFVDYDSCCLWDKAYSTHCDVLPGAFLTLHICTWISFYFKYIHLQAFANSTHCLKCPSSCHIPNSYFPTSLSSSRQPSLALFVPPSRYSFSVFLKHSAQIYVS